MGFIQREIARRWQKEVGWSGSMFDGFLCTALVTPKAQVRALRYVLSQGVKGLVEDPRDWPGFHCAQSLTTGEPVEGIWFDGTAFGRESYRESRKPDPQPVPAAKHTHPTSFSFDKLPALAELDDEAYRLEVARMVDEIHRGGPHVARGAGRGARRRRMGAKRQGGRMIEKSEGPLGALWVRGRLGRENASDRNLARRF